MNDDISSNKIPIKLERLIHLFEHYLPNIKHLDYLFIGEGADKIVETLYNQYSFRADILTKIQGENEYLSRYKVRLVNDLSRKKKYDVVVVLFELSDTSLHQIVNKVKEDGYLFVFTYNFFGLGYLNTRSFTDDSRKILYELSNIKNTDRFLRQYGLNPLLRDVVGHMLFEPRMQKKHLPIINKINVLGKNIPNGRFISPYVAYIYKKDYLPSKTYISEYNPYKRVIRVIKRIVIMLKSNGINSLLGFFEKPLLRFRLSRLKVLESPRKKRLLVCTTWLQVGGVERVLLNLVKDFHKEGIEIHIITSLPNPNVWENEFQRYSYKILHLPRIVSNKLQPWFIAEYIKKTGINSILITNNLPAYHAIPLIRNEGNQITIVDLLHTHGRPEEHDAFLPISLPYNKQLDKRVVISEYLKKYYYSKYPVSKDHIQVVYNSIEPKILESKPRPKKWQQKLNPSNDKFVISYIGRLSEDKSPLRVVEIAKKLIVDNNLNNLVFAVAGDGPLELEMKNAVKKLGLSNKVIFLGKIGDVFDLMGASDLTILTSDMEGIPMSILESMAAGTPVIAPAVGGIPEIIEHNVNGYLVKLRGINAVDMFVNQIGLIIKNKTLHQEIKNNTKNKIAKKFVHMTNEYRELLKLY